MNLIGEVDGKVAIVLDDMIDTGGTICAGAKMLRDRGAKEVYACATHAVFSPPAVERLGSARVHRGHRHKLHPAHPRARLPAAHRPRASEISSERPSGGCTTIPPCPSTSSETGARVREDGEREGELDQSSQSRGARRAKEG